MAKDLIIGVVDNYKWDKIKYWANSIKASGFSGDKALIVYNMDPKTVSILEQEGFMMIGPGTYDKETGFTYEKPERIMLDRFFHIHNFLSMLAQPEDVDRVIITDVRDVVFQDNPTDWLDENIPMTETDIILGSENLKYKDEPWGANNIQKAFGQYFYEKVENNEIYCAGVIAGGLELIKDLCLNLWVICSAAAAQVPGGGGPDQAALNILTTMYPLSSRMFLSIPSDGWVVHAGTSMPAIEAGSGGIGQAYKQNPNMDLPFVHDVEYDTKLGQIYANNKKVTIVHQWDRVPYWKTLVEENFGDQ